jgi:hypothetical protein
MFPESNTPAKFIGPIGKKLASEVLDLSMEIAA